MFLARCHLQMPEAAKPKEPQEEKMKRRGNSRTMEALEATQMEQNMGGGRDQRQIKDL